jgi:hypothetical protein
MKENPTPGMCDNVTLEQPPIASRQQTHSGRQRSKLNAVKTGIFASIVLAGGKLKESEKSYEKLRTTLQVSILPRDNFEQMLVENLAFQFLRLTRIYKADAEVAPLMFEKMRECVERDSFEIAANSIAKGEGVSEDRILSPDLLLRYDTTVWRQFDRIMDQLERWRRMNGWSPKL